MSKVLKYRIIRYIPDTIAGEFVNVGIVISDGINHHKFIKPTERAKNFGNPNLFDNVIQDLIEMELDDKQMDDSGGVIRFTKPTPFIGELEDARDKLLEYYIKGVGCVKATKELYK